MFVTRRFEHLVIWVKAIFAQPRANLMRMIVQSFKSDLRWLSTILRMHRYRLNSRISVVRAMVLWAMGRGFDPHREYAVCLNIFRSSFHKSEYCHMLAHWNNYCIVGIAYLGFANWMRPLQIFTSLNWLLHIPVFDCYGRDPCSSRDIDEQIMVRVSFQFDPFVLGRSTRQRFL